MFFLSSQWQRSPSACLPSSPHHASKFNLVIFAPSDVPDFCLVFMTGSVSFSQTAALGSTAGRLIRRATATRSCAPTDPTTTHPPLAEHRPQTAGLTDKWKYQKQQDNVFSSQIRHVIAASIQLELWGDSELGMVLYIMFCFFLRD